MRNVISVIYVEFWHMQNLSIEEDTVELKVVGLTWTEILLIQ